MLRTTIVSGICCTVLCCLPAFAQEHAAKKMAGGGMTDQEFVDFAAKTDMTEAHIGQLAADQAASDDVKNYAQTLVTDHTADYRQLQQVASKAGMTVPTGIDAAKDRTITSLEKMKGKAFDTAFARDMVAGHTKAIAVYKHESEHGENGDVKAYATQALPTLDKHLSDAKDLEKPKAKSAAKEKM